MDEVSETRIESSLLAPIEIEENSGFSREGEPVRIGLPVPRGKYGDDSVGILRDGEDKQIPVQCCIIGRWPDRSARWILLDFMVSIDANSKVVLQFEIGTGKTGIPCEDILVDESDDSICIQSGTDRFEFPQNSTRIISSLQTGDHELLADMGLNVVLRDFEGKEFSAHFSSVTVQEKGPLRVALKSVGTIDFGAHVPLQVSVHSMIDARRSSITLDVDVWNSAAARHLGNLWDLGDPGSLVFQGLSLQTHVRGKGNSLSWLSKTDDSVESQETRDWRIYQDSSGGEQWNSPNHVTSGGKLSVKFRGYKVRLTDSAGNVLERDGRRASPAVVVDVGPVSIGVTVDKFWQNFPKSLDWNGGVLSAGLMPSHSSTPFELQGGERKRHRVFLSFGRGAVIEELRRFHRPLRVQLDRSWITRSNAVQYFSAQNSSEQSICSKYVDSIIDGSNSFFEKREIIDEYGWRNFGDLYADHEAVGHDGADLFISHYNNQYDFLYAAGIHFMRTGDHRWRELMLDAARHVIDIDIYHTQGDRAAYNGGLFWHTDHYKNASKSTHRTYSRTNAQDSDYGGGPSNEHNYTSGLLQYYYLTGDESARDAVCELADWVVAMDDGRSTLLSLVDERSTGMASSTVSTDFHKPGRGAGNSINALVDAYSITGNRTYMKKAEELLCRVIHPNDDVAALNLGEPEYRWSYLVFLQVLGKYLDAKNQLGENDYFFYYARDSLLQYSSWMLEHEKPYKDVLDKVDLPTETWPAQDIRKSHIMHLAANCSAGESGGAFSKKAEFFFERCISDLLSFETAYLTRPQVLIAVYGHIHQHFQERGHLATDESDYSATHGYSFGDPEVFIPQHQMASAGLKRRLRVLRFELLRILRDRVGGIFRNRFKRTRTPGSD